jgi:hypothetical protein
MNKEQRQIKKIIDQAYSSLRCLNNITWTSYREDLFEMNKQDEKRHRFNRPSSDFEASINDCAKMFTVQNIAESLLKENQFNIKDLINIRKSCLYAQSVVENYKDKILEAWKDQDIKYLADLDYISLIDWKHYQEIISRRVA